MMFPSSFHHFPKLHHFSMFHISSISFLFLFIIFPAPPAPRSPANRVATAARSHGAVEAAPGLPKTVELVVPPIPGLVNIQKTDGKITIFNG
jgi:hypothetical protein